MTAAALFLSTFELVFLLGTQSLVVQADMRRVRTLASGKSSATSGQRPRRNFRSSTRAGCSGTLRRKSQSACIGDSEKW